MVSTADIAELWLAVQRSQCERAPAQARPTMTKSVVLDSVTGESQDSEVRTSTGSFFFLNVRPRRLPSLSLHKTVSTAVACGAGWRCPPQVLACAHEMSACMIQGMQLSV